MIYVEQIIKVWDFISFKFYSRTETRLLTQNNQSISVSRSLGEIYLCMDVRKLKDNYPNKQKKLLLLIFRFAALLATTNLLC